MARIRQECVRALRRHAGPADDGGMADIEGAAAVVMPHWPRMPASRAADTFGPDPDAAAVLRLVVFALTLGSLLAVLR